MRFALLASLALALAHAQTIPPRTFNAPLTPAKPVQPLPDTAELEGELSRFVDVYTLVLDNAADAPDPAAALYAGAIPGMLRKLDPHSVFFDRDQFAQLQEMERSVSKGFGTIVSVLPGRVIILQTMPGSPSQKSGLSPGDEIIAINDIPLSRLDIEQLVQLLGYTRQREAQLLIRRQGTARPLPVTLRPEELQSPSVDRAFLLEPGIGYVRATSFDPNTGSLVQQAIEKLGGHKLKALVLDLRDNPGGVVQSGLATASLFLDPSARIISARGRSAEPESIEAPRDSKPYTFPLAVLVNSKTGSASEIVAGALQDNDRGLIIGDTTFGKGLVQRVFPLSDDTGLALTTAFYYTPSGRSIQKPLHDNTLEAATATTRPEFRTRLGRTVRGGGGIEPDHTVFPSPYSRLGRVLEGSGAYAAFSTEWLTSHRAGASREMQITAAVLDEFQLYLSRRNIRPTLAEWSSERSTIARRLKQEILNQAISVAAGDEIELRADPVVARALSLLRP